MDSSVPAVCNSSEGAFSMPFLPLKRAEHAIHRIGRLLAVAIIMVLACVAGAGAALAQTKGGSVTGAQSVPPELDKAVCLGCHGNEGFGVPGPEGKMRPLHVVPQRFEQSVHGKRQCVECHRDIKAIPHDTAPRKVSCVNCHQDLWEQARRAGTAGAQVRLGVVVERIQQYFASIHSRPNREDQSYTNATCYDCHDAHYVYPPGTAQYGAWRLDLPRTCGNCHTKAHKEYLVSVHGELAVQHKNPAAAVCSDCHTGHRIQPTNLDATRVAIVENCGTCHKENFRSYIDTYHGQVTTLGYGYTAKCFDCHASHTIKRASDPGSRVHPGNRVSTCQKCHAGATPGFLTFAPHANTHDFKRYPYMWIASKFMIALLFGVFAFFWTHSALWFYREYKERRAGRREEYVKPEAAPQHEGKEVRRFATGWRVAHLVFALSVMTLVLTGMAVFYADTLWAKVIMETLQGPHVAGIFHRIAAVTMLSIFFGHVVVVAVRLWRARDKFHWFGPTSLVPTWKDLADAIAMFKWFFGKGPRPVFDRWTYWEKFDYWAVFWGMAIIGTSGFMLWFPSVTAAVLPGWVLNVATLIHGEEAFLAAVFLFTVHFFNNHFRPAKFPPPDIVIFTGSVPLEEFRREHALEYKRLVETGKLEECLVEAPSKSFTLGSTVLGLALIAFGLVLLVLVLTGFIQSLTAG